MRYVLFVCVDPTGEPTDESPRAWVETWNGRGVRIEGMPLKPPAQGKTIRVRGGEVLVTDGPFAELAEWIAGYDLIDASDLDEAIEVARSHPMATAGLIEIRPVDDADLGPGTESVPHDGDAPTSRFLGLFWEDPSAPPSAAAPETVAAWVIDGKASGRYLGGERLRPVEDATTVRVRGGELQLTPSGHTGVPAWVSGLVFLDGEWDEVTEYLARSPLARSSVAELREFWTDWD